METSSKIKLAVIQNEQFLEKSSILQSISQQIQEAAKNGAKYVFLGECFNSLYKKDLLHSHSEVFDAETSHTIAFLKEFSKSLQIYLFGSIPEYDPQTNSHYNTAFAFDDSGKLIAKHRKIHLFDIDIPGKITSKESEVFQAGSQITVFQAGVLKIGMAICYDIRFSELSLLMAKKGAQLLYYPSAFNQTTGPLHWELLLRARALDNQVFVVGASPARFTQDLSVYQAWGHSTVVDPMGKVLKTCGDLPEILYEEINLENVEEIRSQLPYNKQKRNDLYRVEGN